MRDVIESRTLLQSIPNPHYRGQPFHGSLLIEKNVAISAANSSGTSSAAK
jgi:hypothetical protein